MSQIKLNPNFFSYSIYPVSEISVFHQLLLRLLSFYDHCYNMEVLLQMMHQLDIVTHIINTSCLQQVLLLSSLFQSSLLLAHCHNMHSITAHGTTHVSKTSSKNFEFDFFLQFFSTHIFFYAHFFLQFFYTQTGNQTDRQTDICTHRSSDPELKNRKIASKLRQLLYAQLVRDNFCLHYFKR